MKKSLMNRIKFSCVLTFSLWFSARAVTPIVTGIYPAQGEIDGYFSILGSNFSDVTQVDFESEYGGLNSTNIEDINPNYIKISYRSDIKNNGILTFTGSFGALAVTNFPFQYATPVISSIYPTVGTSSQGRATVFGINMRGISKVSFTSYDGNEASINSPSNLGNELRFNFVPNNAAFGVFTLTGSFGKVVSTINYAPAIPTITGINPVQGLINGYITLLGTNLDGVKEIKYKNASGGITTDPVNTSPNRIVHPPFFISTGAITLTGGFGIKISEFSYQTPMPSITGIYPASGVADDGGVTLLGNNMEGITGIKMRINTGVLTDNFVNSSANKAVFYVSDRRVINGVITILGGFGEAASPITFTVPTPSITGLNPQTGFSGDGFLTLTGQNLYFVEFVRFVGAGVTGEYNAQPNPRSNSTLVITDHPNIYSGQISLVGTNFGVINTGIQYTDVVAIPTITRIYPSVGVDENNNITLFGQNLTGLITIHFVSSLTGSVATSNFSLQGYALVRVPADAVNGEISITGVNTNGLMPTNVNFVRTIPPTSTISITGFQASSSLTTIVSEVLITLTGSGFVNGATITIGGVVLTNVSVTGNMITGTIPAGSTIINPSNPSVIIQNPGNSPSLPIISPPVLKKISDKSLENDSQIFIYPNPNNGEFIVKAPVSSLIQVINTSGLLLKEIKSIDESTKLTVYQKGLFLIKISTKTGFKLIKLIIE